MKATTAFATTLMLGFCLTAVAGPVHAAPAQQYTSAVTSLLDAAAGKSIGSVAPGAALEVEGTSGSATHVALHGWFAAGSTARCSAPCWCASNGRWRSIASAGTAKPKRSWWR